MLFKPELAARIVTGAKTQTRRRHYDGDMAYLTDHLVTITHVEHNRRLKWHIGRDYAVQYGRGKPMRWYQPQTGYLLAYEDYVALSENTYSVAFPDPLLRELGFSPLRIQITAIRGEDVRAISREDAIAEGFRPDFYPKFAFWETWCGFYDPTIVDPLLSAKKECPSVDWAPDFLWERPDHLYNAWVLEFRLKETEPC